ncbi:putative membrane protein, partial [Vibrio parahaemolyticus AQ3810]
CVGVFILTTSLCNT